METHRRMDMATIERVLSCDEAVHPTDKNLTVGRRKTYNDSLKFFFSRYLFRETISRETIWSKKKESKN